MSLLSRTNHHFQSVAANAQDAFGTATVKLSGTLWEVTEYTSGSTDGWYQLAALNGLREELYVIPAGKVLKVPKAWTA